VSCIPQARQWRSTGRALVHFAQSQDQGFGISNPMVRGLAK
jgi:hypothetical protein